MEQKANKFIALLIKKFNNANLDRSDLKEAYLAVVTSLKDGRLKTELLKNSKRYQQNVERKCQRSSQATLLKTFCQKVQSTLNVLTSTCPQYTHLVEQLHKIEEKKLLFPELESLCSLLCTREDLSALTNTMLLIFSVLQPAVETCLDSDDHTRCGQLKTELHHLLTFLHLKKCILDSRQNMMQTDTSSVKYSDIMASLLSLYLDLSLSILRSDVEERDVCFDKSDLCGFFCQLVPNLSLIDVLLQLSGFTSTDQEIILPIARKCLLVVPDPVDNKLYTKFMACAHSIVRSLGEEETGDISQVAESLSAPKGYIDWLREQNTEILESLPEDRKFKGRTISRFILREGNAELMEALLDCVTEELPDPANVEPKIMKQVDPDTVSASVDSEVLDAPLFFVDTAGQKTQIQSDREQLNQSTEDKTGNHSDVEVIEVDFSAFPIQPEIEAREWEDNSDDETSHSSDDQLFIDEVPTETFTPSKRPKMEKIVTRSARKPVVHNFTEYNLRKKKMSSCLDRECSCCS